MYVYASVSVARAARGWDECFPRGARCGLVAAGQARFRLGLRAETTGVVAVGQAQCSQGRGTSGLDMYYTASKYAVCRDINTAYMNMYPEHKAHAIHVWAWAWVWRGRLL